MARGRRALGPRTPGGVRRAAAAPPDTLRYAFASEPPSLDPHATGSIWSFRSLLAMCDTLTWQDAKGTVGPGARDAVE